MRRFEKLMNSDIQSIIQSGPPKKMQLLSLIAIGTIYPPERPKMILSNFFVFLYTTHFKMHSNKIDALRRWMVEKGCIIHPQVQIGADFGGVLGIGSTGPLPHKTLIVAVPSSLILTTTRCYNDPKLKKLFQKDDDLFDYEASEDAEFNVLCVFMMYYRIHSEGSQWKEYFEAISEPQTAVDWSNTELKGLNRSIIEEVVHVRRECQKLEEDLIAYLKGRKEFEGVSEEQLRQNFHFCYRAVMNRSFGYYFNQTCLIPVADMVNHGCEAVDHQLINLNFQREKEFQEGYFPKKEKIDCSLLGIEGTEKRNLPFRHRFLVENQIIDNSQESLLELDRKGIDKHLYKWNDCRFKQGSQLEDLHFCSEDEEEDNDTDEDCEYEKERQFDYCKKNEQQQRKQFMNNYVTVEKYKDVEAQLMKMKDQEEGVSVQTKKQNAIDEAKNGTEAEKNDSGNTTTESTKEEEKAERKENSTAQTNQMVSNIANEKKTEVNPFSRAPKGGPVLIDSSSESEEEDEQQWGMKQGSYFTMSTSSPIAANKQIFNSYGSRTNKFLLIWYGFTYPDNLYDSVSLRLHVQFGPLRAAKEIVLDSYVGGQGLSFRKNENEMVKDTEVSREFRLKRTNLCGRLIIFLRLFLMNYYEGSDLYKLFVTFPASVDFELMVFEYFRDIVVALYDRYPEEVIEELRREFGMEAYAAIRHKIQYKLIYLTEQRKLLDLNLKAVSTVLEILRKCKENGGMLLRSMYEQVPMEMLRMIRKYLIQYEKQAVYIAYKQEETKCQSICYQNLGKKKEERGKSEEDQWEDEQQAESK